MYISKFKIFVLFLIICIILYKSQYISKITEDINSFSLRRVIYTNQELPSFPNDYVAQEYAKIYLDQFLSILQSDVNADISMYVEEENYNDRIANNKEAFVEEMEKNLIMVNPLSNYHDSEFQTQYVNKDGHNTYVYNILIMEKGLDYPRGYESLKERDDPDQLKNMDIHVIEYSPYNFKIFFPDKTIIVEDF